MGAEAPAENIIASMVVFTMSYLVPLVIPFLARFGRRVVIRALFVTLALSVLSIGIFSMRSPFDAMHPRRLFVIHSENVRLRSIPARVL